MTWQSTWSGSCRIEIEVARKDLGFDLKLEGCEIMIKGFGWTVEIHHEQFECSMCLLLYSEFYSALVNIMSIIAIPISRYVYGLPVTNGMVQTVTRMYQQWFPPGSETKTCGITRTGKVSNSRKWCPVSFTVFSLRA